MAANKVVKIGKHAELKFYEKSVVFQATNIYLQRQVTERDVKDITAFVKRAFREGKEHQRAEIQKAWINFRHSIDFTK